MIRCFEANNRQRLCRAVIVWEQLDVTRNVWRDITSDQRVKERAYTYNFVYASTLFKVFTSCIGSSRFLLDENAQR